MSINTQMLSNLTIGFALLFAAVFNKAELPVIVYGTMITSSLLLLCRESWMLGASLRWSMTPKCTPLPEQKEGN